MNPNTIQLNIFAPTPLSPLEQLRFDVYIASYNYLFKGRKPEDLKKSNDLLKQFRKMQVETGVFSIYFKNYLKEKKNEKN